MPIADSTDRASYERLVKNIQVIDGAENCVYDVFAASEEEFAIIFPGEQDIAFIDEVYGRGNRESLDRALTAIWTRRIPKRDVQGIHGILFYELEGKKPTTRAAKMKRRSIPMAQTSAELWPNPSIERTCQRPLRALWPAAHVER